MGCGIRREAVGDLCLQPRQCDLFVTAELAPYLLDNLTSAGGAHLTLTRIALAGRSSAAGPRAARDGLLADWTA